jgi:peptidoglycan/LPS O-acetylase OafA/YrhL
MVVATLLFTKPAGSAVFTPSTLLSFLFIPHIAPHGGIHPILALGWTLMYEMFFYLSFALALCLRREVGLAALAAFFFVVHGLAQHPTLLPEALRLFWGDAILFEFLFGVGFYFMQKKGQLPLSRLALVLLLCGTAGTAAWLAGGWSENRVFHFGLPALALLALLYHLLPTIKAGIWLLLVLVGEASYTLYLSHPFMVELMKIPIEPLRMAAEGQIALYLVTSIVVATLFSVAFYARLERRLTRRLMRRLTYCSAPALAAILAMTVIPSSTIAANDASPGSRTATIVINHQMPRATLAMLRTALGGLGGKRILLLGASYREEVADTRYSPSTSFTVWAEAEGAKVDVQDPLVDVLKILTDPSAASCFRPMAITQLSSR